MDLPGHVWAHTLPWIRSPPAAPPPPPALHSGEEDPDVDLSAAISEHDQILSVVRADGTTDCYIVNVVARMQSAPISHWRLAFQHRHIGCKFNPRHFAALTLTVRANGAKAVKVLIFSSGNMVITGANSEHAALRTAWTVVNYLNDPPESGGLGMAPRCAPGTVRNFSVCNFVCKFRTNRPVALRPLAEAVGGRAVLEIEKIRCVRIRSEERFNQVTLVYESGCGIQTGMTTRAQCERMWDHERPVICAHHTDTHRVPAAPAAGTLVPAARLRLGTADETPSDRRIAMASVRRSRRTLENSAIDAINQDLLLYSAARGREVTAVAGQLAARQRLEEGIDQRQYANALLLQDRLDSDGQRHTKRLCIENGPPPEGAEDLLAAAQRGAYAPPAILDSGLIQLTAPASYLSITPNAVPQPAITH